MQTKTKYPPPPDSLKEAGKKAWSKGQGYWDSGIINQHNIEVWQIYCEQFDFVASLKKAIEQDGEFQLTAAGLPRPHPAIQQRRTAESHILKIAKSLGIIGAKKGQPQVSIIPAVASRKRR